MQNTKHRLIYGLIAVLVLSTLTGAWVWTRVINPLPDATNLLQSAAGAGDRVTYHAQVRSTSFHRGQPIHVSSEMSHTPDAERVRYLDGPIPGLLVILLEDETYTIKPDGSAVRTLSPRESQARLMNLMLENHAAVVSGTSKIAGRKCYVVDVMPRNIQGPSKRLYVDKESHVVLRTEDRSLDGKVRASSEMTRIDYTVSFDEELFAPPSDMPVSLAAAPGALNAAQLSQRLGFDVQQPRYVTAGYKSQSMRLHSCSCPCGHESAQISYTNGLSAVSIFQTSRLAHCGSSMCELRPNKPDDDGCMVSDSGQGLAVIVERPDKAVVVVGDLQRSELEKIARSVP